MEKSELKSIFNQFYEGKENVELVLQKLKDAGASQMECTLTLVTELGYSLRNADELVINSKAWEDRKEHVEKFRDNMMDSLDRLFDEN